MGILNNLFSKKKNKTTDSTTTSTSSAKTPAKTDSTTKAVTNSNKSSSAYTNRGFSSAKSTATTQAKSNTPTLGGGAMRSGFSSAVKPTSEKVSSADSTRASTVTQKSGPTIANAPVNKRFISSMSDDQLDSYVVKNRTASTTSDDSDTRKNADNLYQVAQQEKTNRFKNTFGDTPLASFYSASDTLGRRTTEFYNNNDGSTYDTKYGSELDEDISNLVDKLGPVAKEYVLNHYKDYGGIRNAQKIAKDIDAQISSFSSVRDANKSTRDYYSQWSEPEYKNYQNKYGDLIGMTRDELDTYIAEQKNESYRYTDPEVKAQYADRIKTAEEYRRNYRMSIGELSVGRDEAKTGEKEAKTSYEEADAAYNSYYDELWDKYSKLDGGWDNDSVIDLDSYITDAEKRKLDELQTLKDRAEKNYTNASLDYANYRDAYDRGLYSYYGKKSDIALEGEISDLRKDASIFSSPLSDTRNDAKRERAIALQVQNANKIRDLENDVLSREDFDYNYEDAYADKEKRASNREKAADIAGAAANVLTRLPMTNEYGVAVKPTTEYMKQLTDVSDMQVSAIDEKQRAIYNYLYTTEGKDAAEEYYKLIESQLNAEGMEQYTSGLQDKYADGTWKSGIEGSAVSVATNIASTPGILMDAATYIASGFDPNALDSNDAYQWASAATSAIRDGITQELQYNPDGSARTNGELYAFLYQTVMSAADSAANFALVGAAGAAAGLSEAAIGDAVSVVMGSQAASSSVIDGLQKGYTAPEAFARGVIAGSIEALTEHYSIETILKASSMDAFAKNVIISFLSEGSEELASNWANRIVDALMLGDADERAEAYRAYIQQGMTASEALTAVAFDNMKEDASSFIAGGLAASISIGANIGNYRTAQFNSEFNDTMSAVMSLPEGDQARILATDLLSKVGEAGNASQYAQLNAESFEDSMDAIRQAVVKSANVQSTIDMLTGEGATQEEIKLGNTLAQYAKSNATVVSSPVASIMAGSPGMSYSEAKDAYNAIGDIISSGSAEAAKKILYSDRIDLSNNAVTQSLYAALVNNGGSISSGGDNVQEVSVGFSQQRGVAKKALRLKQLSTAIDNMYANRSVFAEEAAAREKAMNESAVALRDTATSMMLEAATKEAEVASTEEELLQGAAQRVVHYEDGSVATIPVESAAYIKAHPSASVSEAKMVAERRAMASARKAQPGTAPVISNEEIAAIQEKYEAESAYEYAMKIAAGAPVPADVKKRSDVRAALKKLRDRQAESNAANTNENLETATWDREGVSLHGDKSFRDTGAINQAGEYTYGLDGLTDQQIAEANADQKFSMWVAERLYKLTGTRYVFFNGHGMQTPFFGATMEDGSRVVYIDFYAKQSIATGKTFTRYTLGHESIHRLKMDNEKAYNELVKFVEKMLGRDAFDDRLTQRIRKYTSYDENGKIISGATQQQIDNETEEIVCEAFERAFGSGALMTEFLGVRAPVARALLKAVRWVGNAVESVLPIRGSNPMSDEAYMMRGNMREAVRAVERAFDKTYNGVTDEDITRREAKKFQLKEETVNALIEHGMTIRDGLIVSNDMAERIDEEGFAYPPKYSEKSTPVWAERTDAPQTIIDQIVNFTQRAIGYIPSGDYSYDGYGPLRSNEEYIWTFDMDTSCPRTFQFLFFRDKLQQLANRPLTYNESIQLLEVLRAYGQNIPCSYCYVENKRVLFSAYYNNFFTYHQNVLNAKTEEEAVRAMYSYNPEKGTITKAARAALDTWRSSHTYNPTVEECWKAVRDSRISVLNWLDGMLERGEIKKTDAQTKLFDLVCEHFKIPYASKSKNGGADKLTDAQKQIDGFVETWRYDVNAGNAHADFDADVASDAVNLEALTLHHEAERYANSASSAHGVDLYAPYAGQLKKIEKDRKNINAQGGIRKHSSNDFRIDYVQDYFMFYADLAAGEWKGHTYTKDMDFVKIFGVTGDRINISIAMHGNTLEEIRQNESEGANWETAKRLRELSNYEYDKKADKFVRTNRGNIGIMAMVTNEAQLTYALNADWIDMIIPFHASGLDKRVWYSLRAWFDFTSTQHEREYNSADKKAFLEELGEDKLREFKANPKWAPLFKTKTDEFKASVPAGLLNELYEEQFGKPKQIITYEKKEGKWVRKVVVPHFLIEDRTIEIRDENGNILEEKYTLPGHHNNVDQYKDLCAQYGVRPRFAGNIVQDEKGRDIDITDHTGYLKVLKETARTDSEQGAIKAEFDQPSPLLSDFDADGSITKKVNPFDYAMEQLEQFKDRGGYESFGDDKYGVIKDFAENYLGKNRPLSWLSAKTRSAQAVLAEAYDEVAQHYFDIMDDEDAQALYDTGRSLVQSPEKLQDLIDTVNGNIATTDRLISEEKEPGLKSELEIHRDRLLDLRDSLTAELRIALGDGQKKSGKSKKQAKGFSAKKQEKTDTLYDIWESEDVTDLVTGYEKVPDQLLGFSKDSTRNKGFADQRYPYVLELWVSVDGGYSFFETAVKGMNRKQAIEIAKRNWSYNAIIKDRGSKAEQDKRYIELAKDPEANAPELQKLVDEAALAWGAAVNKGGSPLKLYRGVSGFGHTVFGPNAIFTTPDRTIAQGYGGGKGYANPRKISEKYIPDDGTAETLIKNYKNILHREAREATKSDVETVRKEISEEADRINNLLNEHWTGLSIDVDEETANAIDGVLWLASYLTSDTLDDASAKEIEYELKRFNKNIADVKRFMREHYSELTSEDDKAVADLLLGYDYTDFAIDVQYRLLPSFNPEEYLLSETGSWIDRAALRDSIEQTKDIGSYVLYGNLGDNPLDIDAHGQFWTNVTADGFGTLLTDNLVDEAKKRGYTSVIIRNVMDPAGNNYTTNKAADDYVFFDSSQLKSADPVTYDDAGNVIPLSRRFNTDNKDIRYQSKTDSLGNALSEEQQNYFRNSKVRDDNGNLLVMYHGTSNYGFTVFDSLGKGKYGLFGLGNYFTADKSVAETYQNKGKGNNKGVYSVYLNITNPIDMDADADLKQWRDAFNAADLDTDYLDGCKTNTDCFRALEDLCSDEQMYKYDAEELIMDTLRGMGYDGITHIGGLRRGNGETLHRVYIALDSERVKSVDNKSPTSDADIRYQTKSARMTNSRIEYLIEDSGAGTKKDYAQKWLTSINPTDFLNLTLKTNDQNRDYFDTVEGDYGETVNDGNYLAYLKKEKRQTPFLLIDENGQVMGHEGRHRMRALEKEGVTSAEVTIEFYDGEDGSLIKNHNTVNGRLETVQSITLSNQYGTGQTAEVRDIVPLNLDHKNELFSKYGEGKAQGEDIRYQAKSTRDTMADLLRDSYRMTPNEALNAAVEELKRAWEADKARATAPTRRIGPKRPTEAETAQTRKVIEKAIEEHGQIEAGENPARESRVPAQLYTEDRVRRWIRTVEEAEVMPEHMISDIERAIVDGSIGATYTPISDKAALHKAEARLKNSGARDQFAAWDALIKSGKRLDKFDVALGEVLLVEAAKAGDVNTTIKIISDVSAAATQSGQVVQAMRLLKKLTPSGQLYYLQRAIDRMNKDFEVKIADGKLAKITLDRTLIDNVLAAKTKEQLDLAMEQALNNIADQLPVSAAEKWNSWRYLAMLFNPRTHIRNMASNIIFMPLRWGKDIISGVIESAVIKDTDKRTKSVVQTLGGPVRFITKRKAGSNKYIEYAAEDFNGMADVLSGTQKYNLSSDIMRRRKPFGKKVLGSAAIASGLNWASDFNSMALEAEDKWFIRKHYIEAMAGFLRARNANTEEIDKETLGAAREYATREALKATYRDFSAAANALNSITKVKGLGVVVEGAFPFKRTPINVLSRGVEYTPAGLAKFLLQNFKEIAAGRVSAADWIDQIGATLSGSAVGVIGWLLAKNGLLTGGGDGDDKDDDLQNATGYQDYALQIGGVSYTIDWSAPAIIPLAIGAAIANRQERDGITWGSMGDALSEIVSPMFDLSMMQSLNDILTYSGYYKNPLGEATVETIQSYLGQAFPTILGQISRTLDSKRRTSFVDKNATGLLDKLLGSYFVQSKIQGKIPGWENQKLAYRDVWGKEDVTKNVVVRLFENMLSPGYLNVMDSTPLEDELIRLYDATGQSKMLPRRVARSVTINGAEINLTRDQYDVYQEVTGGTMWNILNGLITSQWYSSMTDADKADAVARCEDYAEALGKRAIDPRADVSNLYNAMINAASRGEDPLDVLQVYTYKTEETDAGTQLHDKDSVVAKMKAFNFSEATTQDLYTACNYKGGSEDASTIYINGGSKENYRAALKSEGKSDEQIEKYVYVADFCRKYNSAEMGVSYYHKYKTYAENVQPTGMSYETYDAIYADINDISGEDKQDRIIDYIDGLNLRSDEQKRALWSIEYDSFKNCPW